MPPGSVANRLTTCRCFEDGVWDVVKDIAFMDSSVRLVFEYAECQWRRQSTTWIAKNYQRAGLYLGQSAEVRKDIAVG